LSPFFVKKKNPKNLLRACKNTDACNTDVLPRSYSSKYRVRVMVFNATGYNISVKSWRSFVLVEETRVPGENHQPATGH